MDVEAPTFTTTSDLGVEASADPIESLLFFQQAAAEELVDSQEFVEDGVTLDVDAPVVEEGGVENVSIRLEPASTMITQSAPTARPAPSEAAVQGVTREFELNDPSSAPPELAPEPRATPRADEARASEILRQVKIAISPRFEQAVIQLHPAELGRISIQLRVEKDGLVAQVRAEKREALEALEKHIPELRAALSRQGIQFGEFDLALGFHDERKSGDTRGGRSNRTRESDTKAGVDDALANTHALRRILTEGAIDTYA